MAKEERICQFYKISINEKGDVFPCCLNKQVSKLGNIFEDNITEKIMSKNISCECELFKTRNITKNDKMNLQKLHIIFSHECQANCVCCFQHKEKMHNEAEHLKKLIDFINKFKPKYITVLGGEVLIQTKTLDWLENIKKKNPEIIFDIVTNLCVSENTIKRASKIFSAITISFLGITPNSYNKIMGLDFAKTMRNFEFLKNNTNIKLRPKFLAMPTNIYDLTLFLKWALAQNPEKIFLHNIDDFSKYCNLQESFWIKSFAQIEKEIKEIFKESKEYIVKKNKHYISIHRSLAKSLNIDEKYLEDNGFANTIKITS